MNLSTKAGFVKVNEMCKFISFTDENKIKITLRIGFMDMPAQIYYFNGLTYTDFTRWLDKCENEYKDYIQSKLELMREAGAYEKN